MDVGITFLFARKLQPLSLEQEKSATLKLSVILFYAKLREDYGILVKSILIMQLSDMFCSFQRDEYLSSPHRT